MQEVAKRIPTAFASYHIFGIGARRMGKRLERRLEMGKCFIAWIWAELRQSSQGENSSGNQRSRIILLRHYVIWLPKPDFQNSWRPKCWGISLSRSTRGITHSCWYGGSEYLVGCHPALGYRRIWKRSCWEKHPYIPCRRGQRKV